MYLFLAIVALILVVGIWFINQPQFGKNPSGKRLERIKKSPNYQDGGFKNLSETPQLTSDKPMVVQLYKFFTDKIDNLRPATPIPTVKTDLKNLSKDENILVWLGHSGYFMQIDGKTFLIDPTLLSGSPVSFFNKMFDGSNAYLPQDIPAVDYLIITHDHWDHLDYETIKQLKPRIGKVVTGLGVGSHFEY
ncbi:MBL fold metallo-hydrolase [Bergeyella porcorum]|uniref:MBL fold metallo-hydrolase n=1 Tax=Bergeyella porcorum TaxID=1735111 RepID=A0AAU0EYT6_9FLAO